MLPVKYPKPLPPHMLKVWGYGGISARYAVALQQVSLILFSVMAKPSMLMTLTINTDYHYVCEYCHIKVWL